ncbi:C39 family peptidase [Patescibacteria group bacterium]|nr:C39 family peptidase [Patescibacteria group bacterium]
MDYKLTCGGKSKTIVAIIIALIIILIGFFVVKKDEGVYKPPKDLDLISDNVEILQVVSEDRELYGAGITIEFLEENDDFELINMAVDFNHDGQYLDYQTPQGTQTEWIVHNITPDIDPDEPNTYSFIIVDKDPIYKDSFNVAVILSTDKVVNWQGENLENSYYKELVAPKIEIEEIDELIVVDPEKDTGVGVVRAGRNTHLSSHAGMPDITQGPNECAPTAAANSLLWMAKKYNFENKMPSTQNALIDELKRDMSFDNGISGSNYKPGKDAIIARRQLPIVTTKYGGNYESNLFDKMYEEISKNCDVEATIKFKSSRGEVIGGHMVTVVGTWRYTDASQTDNNLSFHDPASPGRARSDLYRINTRDDNLIINYRYGRNAYIKEIYSECYVAPVVTDTSSTPQDQPEDNGTDQGAQDQPEEDDTDQGPQAPIIDVSSLLFTHPIGKEKCPQLIQNVEVLGEGTWEVYGGITSWLQIPNMSGISPGTIPIFFSCELDEYITQDLITDLLIRTAVRENIKNNLIIKISGRIISDE